MKPNPTPTGLTPDTASALTVALAAVEEARLRQTPRLPGIRALAGRAHVSVSTMHKAVALLKKAGVVVSKDRSGLFVASSEHAEQSDSREEPSNKVAYVRQRILKDLYEGDYGSDAPLPSRSMLCWQLGVSYAPLKKACEQLLQEGYLERYKRWYRASDKRHRAEGNSIVLFLRTLPSGKIWPGNPWLTSTVYHLQNRCQKKNVSLHILPTYYSNGSYTISPEFMHRLEDARFLSRTFGFVYTDILIRNDFAHDSFISRLAATGKPVAVVNSRGLWGTDLPAVPTGENIRVFSTSPDFEAGLAVGRFLIKKRHTGITFITTDHSPRYSRERQRGLQAAVADVEPHRGLVLVSPSARQAVTPVTYEPWLKTEMERINDYTAQLLDKKSMGPGLYEHYVQPLISHIRSEIAAQIQAAVKRRNLLPLVERALSARENTAWVCVSDTLALVALDFLAAKGIKVPEQIAVVGFDDSEKAFTSNLTSYDFDPIGLFESILTWVLDYPFRVPKNVGEDFYRSRGYVAERATA